MLPGSHVDSGEHCFRPLCDWNVCGGHGVHGDVPVLLYVPGEHAFCAETRDTTQSRKCIAIGVFFFCPTLLRQTCGLEGVVQEQAHGALRGTQRWQLKYELALLHRYAHSQRYVQKHALK